MTGQLSFSGGEWESFKKIKVIETEGTKKAFLRGHLYMSWQSQDQSAQRVAIAQLYECGVATQEELADAFGISIKSVYNYITSFATGGIQDLIEHNSGPKQRWKLLPEVRAKILMTVLKEGITEYQAVRKKLNNWNVDISIESIRQVLLESGLVRESANTWQGEQGNLFETDNENGQLKIDFCNSEFSIKERYWPNKENDAIFYSEPLRKDRSFYSPAQRRYLDQLEQGVYSAYAGGLLFTPLLKQYNFLKTIKQVIDIEKYEGYSLDELCLSLFYFDLFRFESMENFKTAYPEEFGTLVGRISGPSTFTLRRFLHKVRESGKSEMLTCEFAKEYLKKGLAKWGTLYIDGHFLPYYGIYPINMGWHGVRKIPMKGSYNFLAVDEQFSPWMFLVRPSSEDLLKKIPEIILKAKKTATEVGIADKEVDKLIVMFDREGYSTELFRILDGKDIENGRFKVTFITWAKYADRWVYSEKDIKFDRTATVTYKIQKPERVKYFETERFLKKYGKIRAIVIESGSDNRRAAIYTNNIKMDAEEIIQITCRRWGHENLIKELMLKHLINYSPGYEPEELEEQPMIENPEVKKLKHERANLKLQLSQIRAKFGHEVLEGMEKEASWDEIKNKRISTIADIESIRSQITLLDLKIDELPEKVRYDEAYGEKLLELNYEKKRFLDCIKVFTYNMENQMCKFLLNYYDVKKEIRPVLSMLVKRGGDVKLEDGKLRVRLRRFKNPEINYAVRHLCEDLNQMEPVSLDKFQTPMHYEVM